MSSQPRENPISSLWHGDDSLRYLHRGHQRSLKGVGSSLNIRSKVTYTGSLHILTARPRDLRYNHGRERNENQLTIPTPGLDELMRYRRGRQHEQNHLRGRQNARDQAIPTGRDATYAAPGERVL